MTDNSNIAKYHLNKLHPEKLQFEIYSLREYREHSAEKASNPHSHSYYQIIWFFEAGGTHLVDFKSYKIKENTVIFVTKNQIHAFDKNLDIDGWLIHFNEIFFMHHDVDVFLKYNIFSRSKNPVYEIDFKTTIVFSNYLGIIREELLYRNRFGYEDTIRFLLKALLITLERTHQESGNEKLRISNTYQLQYLQFQELIETHYKEGFEVKEYADLLNTSTKTLTTITRKIAGKSPSELIAERTVLEAKRLLRYSAIQINEVAFNLGFDDPSYFVKFFKKSVGTIPSHFRDSTKYK